MCVFNPRLLWKRRRCFRSPQRSADAQSDESSESPPLYSIYFLPRLLSNKWEHPSAHLSSFILELSFLPLPLFKLISILPAPSALLLSISGSAASAISALALISQTLSHLLLSEKPSPLLHPASIHYAAFLPPSSASLNPPACLHTPRSPSPRFPPLQSQLGFSSCFTSDPPSVPPPPLGSRVSTSALKCPLAAESPSTFCRHAWHRVHTRVFSFQDTMFFPPRGQNDCGCNKN